jgi:aspartate racemase
LLGQVRETALEAYAHQDLPFEKLVEELQRKGSESLTPLPDPVSSTERVTQRLSLSGLSMSQWEIDTQTAKFDLSLSMVETRAKVSPAD